MTLALEILQQCTAAAEPNTSVTFDNLCLGLQQFNGHQIRFKSRMHGAVTGTVRVSKVLSPHHADRIPSLPNLRSSRWFSIRFDYESTSEPMFDHAYIVYDNPYPESSPQYGGIAVVQEMTVDGIVLPQLAVAQSAPVFFQNLHRFELKRISDTHGNGMKLEPKRATAADTVKRVPGIWCGYQIKFDDSTVVPTESGCKGKCMMQYDPVTGRIYQHGRNGFEFHGRMMPGREDSATAAAEPDAASDWENLPDRVQAACRRFEPDTSLGVDYDALEFSAEDVEVNISTAYDTNNGEGDTVRVQFFYNKGVFECFIADEKLVGKKMPNLTPAQWVVVVPAVLTYLDNVLVRTRQRINTEIQNADREFAASLAKMFRVQLKPNMLNLRVTWST